MKKLCMLLAVLMLIAMAVPAVAEDEGAEMARLMMGDWVHEEDEEHYLLFDGVNGFYYSADTFYYGLYTYMGDDSFMLLDDEGVERILTVNDDLSLSLEGVDGVFHCQYRYGLMDFPNTDEGTWLNDDGETTLLMELGGAFELENEDIFFFGEYEYLGGGEYQLIDDEDNIRILSAYDDGSIGLEGVDGYFWLQDTVTGDDPFEFLKEDEELMGEMEGLLPATVFDGDPIPLSGIWYKNGDDSTIPFVLEDGTFSCEHSVFGYESAGTWTLDEQILQLTDEATDPVVYISMEDDDGMSSGWSPIPMAGNRLLYADAKDAYFLHESLVGTEEGETLCRMAEFMLVNWWCKEEESTLLLEFSCMGNVIIFTTIDEDGESFQEIVGRWWLEGDCIVASFTDETTASYALAAGSIEAGGLQFAR